VTKRSFELIVFDLDGTLYQAPAELERIYPIACVAVLARHLGVPEIRARELMAQKRTEVEGALGGATTNTRVLLSGFPDVAFSELEQELASRIDVKRYVARDPLCIEAIRAVQENHSIALYTTSCEALAIDVLEATGLSEFFPARVRVTLSTAGRLSLPRELQMAYIKPNTKGFELVLEHAGVAPEKALMVGDSLTSDIEPAQKLGMGSYLITEASCLYRLPAWLEERDHEL